MNYNEIPLNTLVTVRVKGESKRRSRVQLVAVPGDESKVQVRTGKRGRPAFLPVDRITAITVLKSA